MDLWRKQRTSAMVAHLPAGAEAGPTFSGAIGAEEMVFAGPGAVPAGLEFGL